MKRFGQGGCLERAYPAILGTKPNALLANEFPIEAKFLEQISKCGATAEVDMLTGIHPRGAHGERSGPSSQAITGFQKFDAKANRQQLCRRRQPGDSAPNNDHTP